MDADIWDGAFYDDGEWVSCPTWKNNSNITSGVPNRGPRIRPPQHQAGWPGGVGF